MPRFFFTVLLSSNSNSSSLARGAADALFLTGTPQAATSISSVPDISLKRVLVEVAVLLLVTKKGLHASEDEVVTVVVVVKKGLAVVAQANDFFAEVASQGVVGAEDDTGVDLVVDGTNAFQMGPRTFGTTDAAAVIGAVLFKRLAR